MRMLGLPDPGFGGREFSQATMALHRSTGANSHIKWRTTAASARCLPHAARRTEYTQNQYDGLGRVTQTTMQDGGVSAVSYSDNCTTTRDEAGNQRRACSDALGRLTSVFEDPAGLNYETDYQYDILGNLLTVTQKGGSAQANWRVRNFVYDSLSRLTSAQNPESGMVSYSYDPNGNVVSMTGRRRPAS